jgi:cytoskeleton protein RodZ
VAEADSYTMRLPEGGPGEKLRRAREQAGVGRSEVADWTKINERHLAALEQGDFGALPARPYALGFARAYARAVGLDPEAIAAEVRAELDRQPATAPARPTHHGALEDPAKVPSARLAWIAGLLALAVIVGVALVWRSYLAPAAELPPVTAEAALPPPELSPAAQVSPTAESAVPAAPAPAEAPARSATGGA